MYYLFFKMFFVLCHCMEFTNSVLRIFMTMFMRDIVLPVVFSFFFFVMFLVLVSG